MALDTLRGRTRNRTQGGEIALEIGSDDVRIVSCPVCSRPIVSDARRCPGCRTRLLIGVPLGKASTFAVAGGLLGLLVGVSGMIAVSAVTQPAVTQPAASTQVAAASSGPAPAASTAPVDPAVPATAVAALRQAVAINGRLDSGVDALKANLAVKPFDSLAVASVLRALAADAAVGSDAAARLRQWPSAAEARTALATLYDSVRTTARNGLAAGFANQAAYRTAAAEMLTVLSTVGTATDAARALGDSVGVDLSMAAAEGATP
jgi:hypothetical protein